MFSLVPRVRDVSSPLQNFRIVELLQELLLEPVVDPTQLEYSLLEVFSSLPRQIHVSKGSTKSQMPDRIVHLETRALEALRYGDQLDLMHF